MNAVVEWRSGSLPLKEFALGRLPWRPKSVRVLIDVRPVEMEWSAKGREVTVTFGELLRLTDGGGWRFESSLDTADVM